MKTGRKTASHFEAGMRNYLSNPIGGRWLCYLAKIAGLLGIFQRIGKIEKARFRLVTTRQNNNGNERPIDEVY
jgi:hypothetical protein